jgi:hypothetical protein
VVHLGCWTTEEHVYLSAIVLDLCAKCLNCLEFGKKMVNIEICQVVISLSNHSIILDNTYLYTQDSTDIKYAPTSE